MIQFSTPRFEEVNTLEWLVTNGIGGYASSTISGLNTRRYHGLLVAALNPPTGRQVLLSKVIESLAIETRHWVDLSTNSYPGTLHPQGYRLLTSFRRDPFPQLVYEVESYRLCKTIFMKYGSNTSVIEYENIGKRPISLRLNPLFVFRDYHGLFQKDAYFDFYSEQLSDTQLKIYAHYGAQPIYLHFTQGTFNSQPDWYLHFQYEKEAYRGLEYQEDAYSMGYIELHLEPGERMQLVCTADADAIEGDPESWKQEEFDRQKHLVPNDIKDTFIRDLIISGDQFLVERQSSNGHTIIAGYPWFTDWGRDTMIAMRGLTIALGKKNLTESIIQTFLEYVEEGMIPNRFPDQGETPEYNTIDATLWLFIVLYEAFQKFENVAFIQSVFPKLQEIIAAHIRGTRYHIQITEEGLLYGGEEGVQLTWMDAKVNDFVVTPRRGCPVEINALWYNAIEIYNFFHSQFSKEKNPYKALAKKVKRAFRQYFLNEEGYLNDVVIPGILVDATIRPNQIYALSLPFSILSKKEEKGVLKVVEEHLYTDLGLRSLSPQHPDFKPLYAGSPWNRDTAYHQGTVWAFLWGEYALAYLKQHKFSKKAYAIIREKSKSLESHFYQSDCINGISEVFDGEYPGPGRGCIHQAWSVGMLLKVLL